MNSLLPFVISFFIPGAGQIILKEYKKGGIIFLSYIVLTLIILNFEFLNFVPRWALHIIIMIWAIFDVFDKIEEREGKKSANRNLAFSVVIVAVLFPLTMLLFTTGLFKGGQFFVNEYLNEDRTKVEMNEISTELGAHKNYYGKYPESYEAFISQKPIWGGWQADSWDNPYKYQLMDSLNYKLISAGKDGVFNNEDDIIRSN